MKVYLIVLRGLMNLVSLKITFFVNLLQNSFYESLFLFSSNCYLTVNFNQIYISKILMNIPNNVLVSNKTYQISK